MRSAIVLHHCSAMKTTVPGKKSSASLMIHFRMFILALENIRTVSDRNFLVYGTSLVPVETSSPYKCLSSFSREPNSSLTPDRCDYDVFW